MKIRVRWRLNTTRCSAIRRETALQGTLILAKSGRLELGDNIYGHYRSIFNHCDIIGLQSYRIGKKKRKIRAIRLLGRSRSFKVIEVGTNRKPVCDRQTDRRTEFSLLDRVCIPSSALKLHSQCRNTAVNK